MDEGQGTSVFKVAVYGRFLPLMMVLEIYGRQCAGNLIFLLFLSQKKYPPVMPG